ncbi:ATP-dependent helicase HEPA [Candidatus Vecturithrix granuli]|uniref:site-specific DNA-methyltransferase (adenine-specific) n=1 Tax=Vecturithrix granuli TaxID=1499967 RepID=A0A081C1T9_VECG1|nr:ATP-dependent helicase HEPA [Candidatus Vecturithrix granuli]
MVKVKKMIAEAEHIDDARIREAELRQVRQKHFEARHPKIKEKYRKEDEHLRHELAELLKKAGFPSDLTDRLARWNPYDQNTSADFFDPEWMFGLQDGFDILIGNPPYINIESIDLNLKQTLFETYETCKGRTDIYIAFIKGMMKKLQPFGNLIFIIPYGFTNQRYASLLRELLAKRYFVREIMDTSNYHVFDTANVKNRILSITNCTNQEKTKIKIVKEQSDFEHGIFQEYTINQRVFLFCLRVEKLAQARTTNLSKSCTSISSRFN